MSETVPVHLTLPVSPSMTTSAAVVVEDLGLPDLVIWIKAVEAILAGHDIALESVRVGQIRVQPEASGKCTVGNVRAARAQYEWHDTLEDGLARAMEIHYEVVHSGGFYAFQKTDEPARCARKIIAGMLDKGLMQIIRDEVARMTEQEDDKFTRLRRLLREMQRPGLHIKVEPTVDGIAVTAVGADDTTETALVREIVAQLAPQIAVHQQMAKTIKEQAVSQRSLEETRLARISAAAAEQVADWVAEAACDDALELVDAIVVVKSPTAARLLVEIGANKDAIGRGEPFATIHADRSGVSVKCENPSFVGGVCRIAETLQKTAAAAALETAENTSPPPANPGARSPVRRLGGLAFDTATTHEGAPTNGGPQPKKPADASKQ